MTDLEKMIIGALIVAGLFLAALLMGIMNERRRKGEEEYMQKVEKLLSINIGGLNMLGKPSQKPLSNPPVSESSKNIDREPDNYKDLSDGKYERFSDDDIDEFKEHLTTHQRKRIGG